MIAGSVPRLFAVTRPLREVPEILQFADRSQPLLWTRGDRGCVGIGEIVRRVFRGDGRFASAAETWRRIVDQSSVDDPVGMPGSGLISFGTFAFDDRSEANSVLIVPRLIVSRHEEQAWITEISDLPISQDPVLPEVIAPGEWIGTHLDINAPDEAYLAGVKAANRSIELGETEKIVLARRVLGSLNAADDLRVPLARLAERYTDCWTYAVDGMIGASPETLIRQTGGVITARVLAGTRGRRDNPVADTKERDELLSNIKEHHEHAFAVQSVVTALSPHVKELRTSERPFALRLPNVWHLATDLEAVPSDGGSSLELTAALHPTAAVAGTPTHDAVEAINELEPFDRERYAGAVGWMGAAGDGEWVIALRCAQLGPVEGQAAESAAAATAEVEAGGGALSSAEHAGSAARTRTITAYAGGGIVEGSDPAHEFRETVSKFRPIADAFAPEALDTPAQA